MKGLIQRVSEASVAVDGETIARIGPGLLLLLGVERNDTLNEAKELCRKILSYRVFPDEQGRMNVNVQDAGGSLLVVPQFTLAADTSSGTRPGFSLAAAPELANRLYGDFVAEASGLLGAGRVGTGEFGADMKVALINDGPVTFMLESGQRGSCTKM
ncbi:MULTISPECIES: D-aminoacyl-tRNA deacylase [Marinobacter]|jgi:D-tyrosyl-tRNA(Tyr) deacylase|uniref:D-aminoacyl-tRNA deacylase n=1 Tax=Marinobacter nauticus TaxID=2743 RepID=A0A368USS3_MARNT|nr:MULTISPECIES: D-aminoacyl-tRNA deacylase [Marinobacter]ERS88660.1 D-tyrosyl-tRNA(Tyr) deacylase [Marinobacter sp. EVN1]MBY6222499.1 D-tyrosyl-tRNA(Tyr) deacylase [Marinobacter nauticus]MCW9010515.1 D-aminoacyl-tRNA deacylase [Marinobacter sp.]RBP70474.1 D-tyrosyl-tRNA(Tyr) deacylase [Marinobacter nauticus]RCW31859.1 D-tyrosyl-tRNA(Tyr) deacylase [Marinobacter nauticus]